MARSPALGMRPHPLEPLTEDEIRATTALVRQCPEFADGSSFVAVSLREPNKEALDEAESSGRHPDRESAVVLYDRSRRQVIEVVVGLTTDGVTEWRVVPGVRPKATRRDFEAAVAAVKADPRWQNAMRRRGVTDYTYVEIQPWPPGFADARDAIHGKRVAKALTWVGMSATDNPFARPVDHVIATVDLDAGAVLSVEDDRACADSGPPRQLCAGAGLGRR